MLLLQLQLQLQLLLLLQLQFRSRALGPWAATRSQPARQLPLTNLPCRWAQESISRSRQLEDRLRAEASALMEVRGSTQPV